MSSDKQEQIKLAEILSVSEANLKYDSACNTWGLHGKRGDIYSDGGLTKPDTEGTVYKNGETFNWYVYFGNGNWSKAKKKLSFMDVINNGDGEGRFRFSRLPTEKEKELIRDTLKLRKKRILTEEEKAKLRLRFEGEKCPTGRG